MKLFRKRLSADVVVVGGGLAGVCAAVAAARHGSRVVLLQDRPVLGGNASSEIRMWVCGAHGVENREGGLLEELRLLNYRMNPELKYTLWDHVIYTFVTREPKIRLLLNTTVRDVQTDGSLIRSVTAWNLVSYTEYTVSGKIFIDCSGDSILRLSGADAVTGRECRDEFDESLAPAENDAKTMGSSILMQLRKNPASRPFTAPEWAYHFTDKTMLRQVTTSDLRRENFWWLEFGGVKDTIRDADEIRHELLKIALGSWEYIRRTRPEAAEWELDWIGALPGKRESARYRGLHVLSQKEVEGEGRCFEDGIGHGGWTMDDHNPKAFFTSEPATIFHPAPRRYAIPFRSLVSRNIRNLMFAGRNISVTHMALSSTRVMATCSVLGQAAGTGAALAVKKHLLPRQIAECHIALLQKELQEDDQLIPWRKRTVPRCCSEAEYTHPVLKNGIEREEYGGKNGIMLQPGKTTEIRFRKETLIRSFRLVFDSCFADAKQQRCFIAEPGEDLRKMPAVLAKAFTVEALRSGKWVTVYREQENIRRLVREKIKPVLCSGIRLKLLSSWGGGEAGLFAMDASR